MTRIGISLAVAAALAAAAPWNLAVDANLTLSQNAYTTNWGGGATGMLAYAMTSNSLAEKQLNEKMNSKSTLKLAFGQTATQDTSGAWGALAKAVDEINLESVLRFTLGAFVDPFASAQFQSQFWDKSDSVRDRFINPLVLNEALGIARVWIKGEKNELTSRLGAGFKQRLDARVSDVLSNYGGLMFATDYTSPFADERITYTSKLSVFQALFFSEATADTAGNWKSPDVGWENVFTAGITKFLMVNLGAQVLYDKEIHTKLRLKETLALGLTYKLI